MQPLSNLKKGFILSAMTFEVILHFMILVFYRNFYQIELKFNVLKRIVISQHIQYSYDNTFKMILWNNLKHFLFFKNNKKMVKKVMISVNITNALSKYYKFFFSFPSFSKLKMVRIRENLKLSNFFFNISQKRENVWIS